MPSHDVLAEDIQVGRSSLQYVDAGTVHGQELMIRFIPRKNGDTLEIIVRGLPLASMQRGQAALQ